MAFDVIFVNADVKSATVEHSVFPGLHLICVSRPQGRGNLKCDKNGDNTCRREENREIGLFNILLVVRIRRTASEAKYFSSSHTGLFL